MEKKRKKQAYDYALHMATLDRILIQPRKEKRLPDRLAAAAGKAPSKQAYIILAVETALDADGIPMSPEE